MDVDLFFGPAYDMLSLDEMLEGDIKYSVELGLELKENSLSGSGDLASVADRGTLDWGDLNHSTLDLLGVDTTPGMMVNPKWVIPSLDKTCQIKEEPLDIKEEIKSDCEDNGADNAEEETEESRVEMFVTKQEVEEEEEECEEEDDEEEDEDDDDDDQGTEEIEDHHREAISKIEGQTIWNRMLNRPAHAFKSQRVHVFNKQSPEVVIQQPARNNMKNQGISLLRVNNAKLLKSAEQQLQNGTVNKRPHHMIAAPSRHQTGSIIRVKPVENLVKTSRIIKSSVVTTDNFKRTIVVNNGTASHNHSHNNGRTVQTIKTKTPINSHNNARSVLVKRFLNIENYPKPAYSYSCLIAMALKNSVTGSLPVSEIYNFMCEHFPYFKSAPSGWKNSVRHNLSLNKCFEKIEKGGPAGSGCRKGCLWAMNPDKISKMDDEVAKWSKKDPNAIRRAMKYPEDLEKLERGDLKIGFSRTIAIEDQYEEDDERSEVDDESGRESCEEEEEEDDNEEEEDERQIESCGGEELDSEDEGEVPPSLRPFDQNNRLDFRHSSQLSSRLPLDLSEEMYEELDILNQVVSSEEEPDIFTMSQAKRPRLQCVLSPVLRQPVRPV